MPQIPTNPSRARPRERTRGDATIRLYPDGPALVRGAFSIVDEHGRTIDVKRKTVSLCRCGRTGLAPLCDGSHARRSRDAGSGRLPKA